MIFDKSFDGGGMESGDIDSFLLGDPAENIL
jgi:hypothetical protein